jgi:hypothetical protein
MKIMDKKGFLKGFLIFSGIFEIFLAFLFIFFMDFFVRGMGLSSVPLFSQMAGVELLILGFLLVYCTKDIETYVIIPITSIVFRLIMAGVEIINMFLSPQLAMFLIPGSTYDVVSSLITLVLLKKCDYI